MKRGALIGALVGGAIPLAVWVAHMFFGYTAGTETVVLWPSSFVLLGLEYSPSMSVSAAVWFGSALINVALYAFAGLCVAAIYRLVTRRDDDA
jgi:hypothetical protein